MAYCPVEISMSCGFPIMIYFKVQQFIITQPQTKRTVTLTSWSWCPLTRQTSQEVVHQHCILEQVKHTNEPHIYNSSWSVIHFQHTTLHSMLLFFNMAIFLAFPKRNAIQYSHLKFAHLCTYCIVLFIVYRKFKNIPRYVLTYYTPLIEENP